MGVNNKAKKVLVGKVKNPDVRGRTILNWP